MNDDTFEERFSITLTPINLFSWGGILVISVILITASILAFTPLREYIPGYADTTLKKNASYAALRADSLSNRLRQTELLLNNIKGVINGNPIHGADSAQNIVDISAINANATSTEEAFRTEFEANENYNITNPEQYDAASGISSYFFFSPVKGTISGKFDATIDHYGIDIVTAKDEPVKSTVDGTVVFAGWTSDAGYVVEIQHENSLISIYKHNAILLKKQGEYVKAGDVIAIVGNSGKYTTGPHLHFELWYNGKPLDPAEYMLF